MMPGPAVVSALTGFGVRDPVAAVRAAIAADAAVPALDEATGAESLGLARYAVAEDALAEGLARLMAGPAPLEPLDPTQAAARSIARNGVSVVTTTAGDGAALAAAVPDVAVVRSADVLTAVATRFGLRGDSAVRDGGGGVGDDSDGRERGLPRVVLVTEAECLGVEDAALLVEAVPDGAHLVLMGDPAALPSSEPGQVLADVIAAGVVPVTPMPADGAIARLAEAVAGGALPRVPDPVAGAAPGIVVVPAGTAAEAVHRAVQLVTASIPKRVGVPAERVGVLAPSQRGEAGTRALTAALTEAAGPREDPWAVTVRSAAGHHWPAVVAVMPGEAGGTLSRPLAVTAFGRATRHLSIVHAAGPALAAAVRDVVPPPRRTRLAALLKEAAQLALDA
jgi:exodeoxyribonuclease V alpha subunit